MKLQIKEGYIIGQNRVNKSKQERQSKINEKHSKRR